MPIKHQGYTTAPIHIGKHCWIGSNVIILKGVTVGYNCVIGAGCVIYKDIPANSVVVNKQDLVIKAKSSFKVEIMIFKDQLREAIRTLINDTYLDKTEIVVGLKFSS